MEHEEKHHAPHHESHETHEQTHHESSPRKSKKVNKKIPAIIALIAAIVIVGGLAWIYTGNLSAAKEKVLKTLPLPAAIVDMKPMSAEIVIDRIALSKKLLESQGFGDQADPAKDFDQLIDNMKLEVLASKRSVSATSEQIDEEYKNIVQQYADGDEETLKGELEKTYGMTPDEFKDQIVRQQVLQANLLVWYNGQEDFNKQSYDKARELQGKLNSGQSFDEVAKEYTQDEATKDFAGDSGIIPFNDLLPEFRSQLGEAKVDDIKLLNSRYGLHILKVLTLNNDGENGDKQIHLQQIFIKQDGFAEWLEKESNNLKVLRLLKF